MKALLHGMPQRHYFTHSLVLSTISSGDADTILHSLLLQKVSSGGSHAPKRLLRGALVFVNL